MAVELKQILSQIHYQLDLVQQHIVKLLDVQFNVWSRFVDFIQESHLVLNHTNNLVDVISVTIYQLVFFFQNLLN